MISTACTNGRHAGTTRPEGSPAPTLDQDNQGRLVGNWYQPPCTGRVPAPGFAYGGPITPCACPCHTPGAVTT